MKLAVIFPGQGSQNKDMAEHFSNESSFNNIINIRTEILNYDIKEVIKDDHKINDTIYTQPLMLAISYAMWDTLIKNTDINPYLGAVTAAGEIQL